MFNEIFYLFYIFPAPFATNKTSRNDVRVLVSYDSYTHSVLSLPFDGLDVVVVVVVVLVVVGG